MLKSFCCLDGEIQHLGRIEYAFFLQILLERYSVNKLHDYIFHIVTMAYIVHRDDIGVRKHGDSL